MPFQAFRKQNLDLIKKSFFKIFLEKASKSNGSQRISITVRHFIFLRSYNNV